MPSPLFSPSEETTVLSAYSRAQAIEDGVLVDVTHLAKEAGFLVPVALTSAAWTKLAASPEDVAAGQSAEGRVWDLLNSLRVAIRAVASGDDTVRFGVLIGRGAARGVVAFKACIGPGDTLEPVFTVMLPRED